MCCLFLRFSQHIGVGNPGGGEEKASLGNNICSKDAHYSFTTDLDAGKEGGRKVRVGHHSRQH